MIAQSAPAQAPGFETAADIEFDDRCVAELVIQTLCSLHSVGGRFVRLKATLGVTSPQLTHIGPGPSAA